MFETHTGLRICWFLSQPYHRDNPASDPARAFSGGWYSDEYHRRRSWGLVWFITVPEIKWIWIMFKILPGLLFCKWLMGFEHMTILTILAGLKRIHHGDGKTNEWKHPFKKPVYPFCYEGSHDFLCTGADIPFAVHRPLHGHMELYYRRSNIGQMQQE